VLASSKVFRTGRPAHSESGWSSVSGDLAGVVDKLGVRSIVSSPISVHGKLWGTIVVISPERLPADTEQRLANFTALVGTAIANADTPRIGGLAPAHRRRVERGAPAHRARPARRDAATVDLVGLAVARGRIAHRCG
jgi:GAF domain-containing protein